LVAPHGLGFREYFGVVGIIVTSWLRTTARRHLERCAPSLHTKHHQCDTENVLQKSEKSESLKHRIDSFTFFRLLVQIFGHMSRKSLKSLKKERESAPSLS
jgi:hypothetical protein